MRGRETGKEGRMIKDGDGDDDTGCWRPSSLTKDRDGTRTLVVGVRLPDTSRSRMRTRGEELGHRATAIARKSCVDIDTD